jgi:hypothetical protein
MSEYNGELNLIQYCDLFELHAIWGSVMLVILSRKQKKYAPKLLCDYDHHNLEKKLYFPNLYSE